jgi:hypothetical protein
MLVPALNLPLDQDRKGAGQLAVSGQSGKATGGSTPMQSLRRLSGVISTLHAG